MPRILGTSNAAKIVSRIVPNSAENCCSNTTTSGGALSLPPKLGAAQKVVVWRKQPNSLRLRSSSVNAFNLRANTTQLLDDAFIATIDVVDAVDDRLAVCHQSRKHQGGAGAEVAGYNRRTRQRCRTSNLGAFSID